MVGFLRHVLVRLLLVLAGYILAVLAGMAAVGLIYAALSALPGAPAYFDAVAISPLVVIAVPGIAVFMILIALVVTAGQAAFAALLSECFGIRSPYAHMLFAALIGVSGFVMTSPTMLTGIAVSDWADIAIIAAASLVAGLVYWLVAGRDAGLRP